MDSERNGRTAPLDRVERVKTDYIESLQAPDPEWPQAVQMLYSETVERLFEEGLTAKDIVESCGFRDHNVYTRFRYEVGQGLKELIVTHRVEVAKRLLTYDGISIAEIAYAVGYSSPSGFSTTFKRYEGSSPSEHQCQHKS